MKHNPLRIIVLSIIALGVIVFFSGDTQLGGATVCFPFQGCTGTSTAPRAGQVLIGNSSSTYTPAYLTAGSNITITTSSGAITITGAAGFTLPSLTSGSVLFSNGTTIAQDNSNFFWDDSNNRLGIGVMTPEARIDIRNGVTSTVALLVQAIANQTAQTFQIRASDGATVRVGVNANGSVEIGNAPQSEFFNLLNVGGNIGTNGGVIRVQNVAGTTLGSIEANGSLKVAQTFNFTQPTGGETGIINMGLNGRNANAEFHGLDLSIIGNGAKSGATNGNAGDLIISAGISTGNGSSSIVFKSPPVGSSGTSDNTPVEVMRIRTDKIGIGTPNPSSTLHIAGSSSTLQIGSVGTTSCLAMSAASGTVGTLVYVYFDSSAVMYSTTTKPSFCR